MTNLDRIGGMLIGAVVSMFPAFFLSVASHSLLPLMLVPFCGWLGFRNMESIDAWLDAKS